MKKIELDVTNKKAGITICFLVDCITVIGNTLIFNQNGLERRYHLDNYEFTIKGSVEI